MNDAELQNVRQDLHNYLSRLTGDEEKAADLTQEAFLRVMKKGMNEKGTDEFRAYLFRSAYNLMIDHKRADQRHPDTQPLEDEVLNLTSADDEDADALEEVINKEMNSCIRDLQLQLPDSDREAMDLVVYGGLKVREAAAVLGLSVEAMKVRLHRARNRLRELMDCNCNIGPDEKGKLSCDKK